MKNKILLLCLLQNLSLFSVLSDADKKLFNAIKSNNLLLLNEALDAGANVNARDDKNLTPLHYATHSMNPNLTNILITNGADVNVKDPKGFTPLHYAANKNFTKIVNTLIANGADVNVKNFQDNTPLHLAALQGHLNAANALIAKKGIDVNVKNFQDNTPLHLAATAGDTDIVNSLITKGADVNAKNTYDETPLQLAVLNSHMDTASALIKAEALFNDPLVIKISLSQKDTSTAHDYVTNLKPGVSRRWNFPETDLTLREQILKEMYEDYMNGNEQALRELLSDDKTPSTVKTPFQDFFIQTIQETNYPYFTKKSKTTTIKKRNTEMRAKAEAISASEDLARMRLKQEHENEIHNILEQEKLGRVRVSQQEKLRSNVGL